MPNRATSTPTNDSRYPDQETADIVEQMKKEGFEPPVAEEPQKPAKEDEEEPEKKEKPAPKKKEESEEEETEKEPEKEPKAPESTEKEEAEKPRRQVLIPVARVKQNEKKLRDEISDLKKQLAAQGADPKSDEVVDKVEQITKTATTLAEKHTADPELVKDILKAAAEFNKQGVTIPQELADALGTIKSMKDEMDQQKETEKIMNQYDDEFSKDFNGRSEDAKARAEEIRATGLSLAEFKERLQALVLGEEGEKYSKLSLVEVFQLKRADLLPKKAKSADAARGRTATGKTETADAKTIDEYTPEEIAAMSDEEFEKVSDALGAKSKSKVTRNGRPVN